MSRQSDAPEFEEGASVNVSQVAAEEEERGRNSSLIKEWNGRLVRAEIPSLADRTKADAASNFLAVRKTIVEGFSSSELVTVPFYSDPEDTSVASLVKKDTSALATQMVVDHKAKLMGVTMSMIESDLVVSLIAAKASGTIGPILTDCVFSIFVAYGLSSEYAATFKSLPQASLLLKYNVDNRKEIKIAAGKEGEDRKITWVTSSSMNASAVRLLGSLAVELASRSGDNFLTSLKANKGTVFEPVKNETEFSKLQQESARGINPGDRTQLGVMHEVAKTLWAALASVFGKGGVSLEDAIKLIQAFDRTGFATGIIDDIQA